MGRHNQAQPTPAPVVTVPKTTNPEPILKSVAEYHSDLKQAVYAVRSHAADVGRVSASYYLLCDLEEKVKIDAGAEVKEGLHELYYRCMRDSLLLAEVANDYVTSLRELKKSVDAANAVCDTLMDITHKDEKEETALEDTIVANSEALKATPQ